MKTKVVSKIKTPPSFFIYSYARNNKKMKTIKKILKYNNFFHRLIEKLNATK